MPSITEKRLRSISLSLLFSIEELGVLNNQHSYGKNGETINVNIQPKFSQSEREKIIRERWEKLWGKK